MLLFGIVMTALIIYAVWFPDHEFEKETRIKLFWITSTVLILLVLQFHLVPNIELGVGLKP